jgi:ribosome maturation factor RimP
MNLADLLERTLPSLGYELVDWDSSPKGRLVRVFIDKPGGVDVEDCARVSEHLTRLFPVEGIEYERLEVSSPGLDRPLKRPADFTRFAGEEAELKVHTPIDNARKLKGVLKGIEDAVVQLETPQGLRAIPLAEIERARLVPRIDWRKSK